MNLIDFIRKFKRKLIGYSVENIHYVSTGMLFDLNDNDTGDKFNCLITPKVLHTCNACKKQSYNGRYSVYLNSDDQLFEDWLCEKCYSKQGDV